MRNLFLGLFFLILGSFSTKMNAQTYSYVYSGTIADSASFQSRLDKIETIESSKIRMKEGRGEILFQLKPHQVMRDKEGNVVQPDPLGRLNALLFDEGLQPIELNLLKQ